MKLIKKPTDWIVLAVGGLLGWGIMQVIVSHWSRIKAVLSSLLSQ
ncbi:MAG TPA: hypothetical protein VMB21_04905 [Candidatus Limnocylindria bacterium]|jgi:hypothetical protein|nr:hypothetical protein [Candidatus Limnocylindria bacterium]HTL67176.1 hypothetical protein [Lacunisphaera sp.]